MRWKLRERLTALVLGAGLIPLVVVIVYTGVRIGGYLKQQASDYLRVKVESFARMAEVRGASIEGNLDIIKEQLMKTMKTELINEAAKESFYETGYLAIFTSDGTCIYHPDARYRNNRALYNENGYVRKAVEKKKGELRYNFNGVDKISYLAYVKPMDWVIWAAVPAEEALAEVRSLQVEMLVFLLITGLVVASLGLMFSTRIAKRARQISNGMMEIAQGEADLSKRLPVLSSDEVGEIASWFNNFVENLEEVISKVKLAAIQVDTATKEVAVGAQGLSQATQEQASAIEEMTSSIKHNAENANDGRVRATEMVRMANSSGEAAHELVRGMSEISEASKKIGDIIVTVNEVAFQTNLLALNAAVEAARAGEHGKGFAVVAEEVRALAQRSAEAARQIKALIEDTVDKIAAGDTMVKKSGESLEQIIRHIQDLSQVMEEIAAASSEQASGVDELNRAISQIDTTTQQNASTVEQLASTSDNLSAEAKELADTVARFKVSREVDAASVKKGPYKAKAPAVQKAKPAKKEPLPEISEFDDDFEEF